MQELSATDDVELDRVLERWDELCQIEGREAADAFVRSLPGALRERVERDIRRIHVARQALATPVETEDAIAEEECDATGVPGRYEILKVHAVGGMGVVYLARDLELNREVAYKVMRRRYRDDPEAEPRFLQEAQATAGLQHAGIVPVLGFVRDGCGLPAYAMEFVEGLTLRDAIEQLHDSTSNGDAGPPVPRMRELLRHFIAACQTIAYAHEEKHCVHGDLKPANILIDQYGGTRVLDWGVCRIVSPDDAPPAEGADAISRRIFTREFGGPSAAQGGEPATFESDIHALGGTLFNLLTGRLPSTVTDCWAAQIPKPLSAICLKAMAPERRHRYRSASAIGEDIQRYLDDEPNSVYVDPWPTRLRRLLDRHRTMAVAGLLTFVFVCLAVTGGTLARNSFQRAALREQDRIRFESGRAPIETLLTLGAVEYIAKDREKAIETYNGLVKQAEDRCASPFATDLDLALLGRCEFYRGLVEIPTQVPLSRDGASLKTSSLNAILLGLRTGGLLPILGERLDPRRAENAEAWLHRATATFDRVGRPDILGAKDSMAQISSWLSLAFLHLKQNRFTEALIDWDRAMAVGKDRMGPDSTWSRGVIRMAAEQEQSRPAWSRPPRAQDPKVMKLAEYLAEDKSVTLPAIYNAACIFSLASLDEKSSDSERERRAARAIAYLKRLAERDYFRESKRINELLNDPDLNALRSRHDFQAISARAAPGP